MCGSLHRLLLVKLAFIIKQVITQSTGSNSTGSGLININRTLNPNSIYLKASSKTGWGLCEESECTSVCVCVYVRVHPGARLRKVLIIPLPQPSTPIHKQFRASVRAHYKAPIRSLISGVYLSSHSSLFPPHPPLISLPLMSPISTCKYLLLTSVCDLSHCSPFKTNSLSRVCVRACVCDRALAGVGFLFIHGGTSAH